MAYQSDESGEYEIYVVQHVPCEWDGNWQISSQGGVEPTWSRDGKELYLPEPGSAS